MRQIISTVQIKGERSWHLMVHSWPSLTRTYLLLCWSKAVNISAQSAFTSIARHWKLNLPNSCWNDFHIFLLLVAQINVELNVAKIKHFFLSEKSFVKKGLEKKFLLENFLGKKKLKRKSWCLMTLLVLVKVVSCTAEVAPGTVANSYRGLQVGWEWLKTSRGF